MMISTTTINIVNRPMRKYGHIIFLSLLLLTLSTVLHAATPPKTFTVKLHDISKTLYFNGTVRPIDMMPVISPTQGVVNEMHFTYGQIIQKGQPLLTVNTDKITSDLNAAEMAFLKAKDQYAQEEHWQDTQEVVEAQYQVTSAKRRLDDDKNTYSANQHLYKLGIIAKMELSQSEDAYDDAQMAYQQAQLALKTLLEKGQGDQLLSAKLMYENAKQKYDSLKNQAQSGLITAPSTGIALIPPHVNNNTTDKTVTSKIQVGSNIQYQQVLLTIGNLQGIEVNVNIPETNIDQINPGLAATVTSASFADTTLHGTVTEVSAQANPDQAGLSTYQAIVSVAQLTDAQRKLIRSGMNAQVAISLSQDQSSLVVPVAAVKKNQHQQDIVMLYDAKTHQQTPQAVITGRVTPQYVQIVSGLQQGQQVIIA